MNDLKVFFHINLHLLYSNMQLKSFAIFK